MSASTDPVLGLTAEEAARIAISAGPNELPQPAEPALLLRLARHLAEPVMLLLITVAVLSATVLHEIPEAVAIAAIIVVDAVIGLREEGRAGDALRALRRMRTPTSLVRRDGIPVEISAREIVPGDIVLLAAGDRIPADLQVIDANDAMADESILTGESLPVSKTAGERVPGAPTADQPSLLFSSTLLVRGTAVGLVVATGMDSSLGAVAGQLERAEPPTPLQRELSHLSARLGVAAIVICIAVFLLTFVVRDQGLKLAFLSAVALAVAAVPQGLPAVVTVGLALGARRMADEGAVVRRLSAVEALGSTTVILTDKTGTLTEGLLRTEGFLIPGGDLTPLAQVPVAQAEWLQAIAVLCNDASEAGGDPVDVTLIHAMEPLAVKTLRTEHPRIDELPFSSERMRMSVACAGFGPENDRAMLLMKGSPETVLALCSGVMTQEMEETASALAAKGMRVLAFARRDLGPSHALTQDLSDIAEAVERDCTFVGLVAFRDPARKEALTAIAEARAAGITLVMVTGDHPGTAAAIAEDVGLYEANAPVRTGDDIRAHGIPDDPAQTAVYARMEPEQKYALVARLQERGEIVAVTGDGVNDAPALRHADIGVAMGGAGSDVARDASDMVITDDNLATIVTAVREGRGIYEGIRKVVDYLVAGNLSEITVVLAGLLFFPALGVPLFPLQLLWINLVTDGLPALALGADPPVPGLMRQPPRARGAQLLSGRRFRMLLGRALVMGGTAVATLAIARFAWGEPWDQARTVMFTSLITTHLFYAFIARLPATGLLSNWRLLAGIAISLTGQVLIVSVPALHGLFDVVAIEAQDWALIAMASVVALVPIGLARSFSRAP